MPKVNILADIDVIEESLSGYKATYDKMFISYDLLHTLPEINGNGETYDPEVTEEKAESIVNGYVNIEHEGIFNVGSVLESKYVELENGGKITANAVLWKSALKEFGITPEDIKSGRFKISMEVAYKDNYYLWGNDKIESSEADEELINSVGQTYDGKFVARVIYPYEFKGNALTERPADKKATIKKTVARLKENFKEEFEEDSTKIEGGQDMPYKKFETEEEYNDFRDSLATEIKGELKEDEDFIDEVSEEKIKEVKASYSETLLNILDESEAEDIDGAIDEIENTIAEFKEYKENNEKEKLFKTRVAELNELGVKFDGEELEDIGKDDLIEMSKASYNILKKTVEKAVETAEANIDDEKDDDAFDPNSFNINDNADEDVEKMVENYLGM